MYSGEWRPPVVKKENESMQETQRNCESFQEALSENLIGALQEKENKSYDAQEAPQLEFLSSYEKKLFEQEQRPKINILIDIDGVLIDTEAKIGEALRIFGKDMHLLRNAKEAIEASRKAKIPFDSLRNVLKCKRKCENVVLVTDRFGVGPCYFPCFNRKGRKVFEGHGIDVSTDNYKFIPYLADGKKFLLLIDEGDITYYVGSSGSDRKYVEKMRREMEDLGIPQEKLIYNHVQKNCRKNFL